MCCLFPLSYLVLPFTTVFQMRMLKHLEGMKPVRGPTAIQGQASFPTWPPPVTKPVLWGFAAQSVFWGPVALALPGRILSPVPDLLKQKLQFNKIPRGMYTHHLDLEEQCLAVTAEETIQASGQGSAYWT